VKLTPGMRLFSATSSAQVVVVRAPSAQVDVACAGAPMTTEGATDLGDAPTATVTVTLLLGKRYADEVLGIELLCTRAGAGPLSCDGVDIPLKEAKPLPASD